MEIKLNVGENIRRYRKEKGYTQKQFAEKCGFTETSIKKYESGEREPSVERLEIMCSVLGVKMEILTESLTYMTYRDENDDIQCINITPDGIAAGIHYYYSANKEFIEGGLLGPEREIFFNMVLDMYGSYFKNVNKIRIEERWKFYEENL